MQKWPILKLVCTLVREHDSFCNSGVVAVAAAYHDIVWTADRGVVATVDATIGCVRVLDDYGLINGLICSAVYISSLTVS